MSPSQVELKMVMEVGLLERNFQSLYTTNLLIIIEMLPCPFGFEYQSTSMMCTCDSKLVEYGMNCSINKQTVWRKSSFWIATAEECP